ncbi:MAG: hypothetical protein ACE145_21350 [Terriglobia bacterium]
MAKFLVCSILVVELSLLTAFAQGPQELAGSLDRIIQDYKVSEVDLGRGLIKVAKEFDVPLAVEWIKPAQPQPISLSWRAASVRQILEAIAATRPGYRVEIVDRTVHVFYRGAQLDRTNFLNLRLTELTVRNQFETAALYDLRGRINQILFPRNTPSTSWRHYVLEPNERRITVDFKDASVRQVLDRLSQASDHKIWSVTFPEGSKLTPTGFRRTVTLWNDDRVPDSAEPVWDRFVFGKPLSGRTVTEHGSTKP